MPHNNQKPFPKFKNTKEFWKWFDKIRPSTVYLIKDKQKYDAFRCATETICTFALESNPDNTSISIRQDELLSTSICVEITTDLIVFENMRSLCDALEKVDNMEIVATTKSQAIIGLVFEEVYYFAPPTDDPFPEMAKGYGEPIITKKLK